MREISDIFRYDSFSHYIEVSASDESLSEQHKYNIREYKKKMDLEIEATKFVEDDEEYNIEDSIKNFESNIYK